uniref:Uncharacterized protein n=1 Tax=Anguilla anguilla TaxID=7936 RepID=A0A0E9XX88_ANGAN
MRRHLYFPEYNCTLHSENLHIIRCM